MNKFPLLKLPKDAQEHVVKIMDFIPLIGLSLVSKTSKALVATAKVQCKTLSIDLRSGYFPLTLQTNVGTFVQLLFQNYCQPLQPQSEDLFLALLSDPWERESVWRNPRLSFSQWVAHLKSIFVIRSPVTVLFDGDHNLSMDDICANFLGLAGKVIFNDGCRGRRLREIVTNFLPTIEMLEFVEGMPPREMDLATKISIQNLTTITHRYTKITCLDTLLLGSAAFIRPCDFSSDAITNKTINRFLKCWAQGSNPRLERFECRRRRLGDGDFESPFNRNSIFRGITFQDVPWDVEKRLTRTMIECSEDPTRNRIQGGREVRNKTGKVATILMDEGRVEMFVWH